MPSHMSAEFNICSRRVVILKSIMTLNLRLRGDRCSFTGSILSLATEKKYVNGWLKLLVPLKLANESGLGKILAMTSDMEKSLTTLGAR